MPLDNWNDLRYVLAFHREKSLAAAARRLGVDESTVSRRITALQKASGIPFVQREANGALGLTAEGAAVAAEAESIESHVERIGEMFDAARDDCRGTVRLTSVPLVINRLLTPRIGELLQRHPGLVIELIPDHRNLSLMRREADIALRLSRPSTGGTAVKARCVGRLHYGIYALAERAARASAELPWIGYDDSLGHIAPARWIDRVTGGDPARRAAIRVHDVETALEAVIAGFGQTLLPCVIADRIPQLQARVAPDFDPPPVREVWLLTHGGRGGLRRIRAVIDWLGASLLSGETTTRSGADGMTGLANAEQRQV